MSEQTSVMIVDDEAPARARLRELLGDLAKEFKVEVAGEASSGTEALMMIESLQPHVVFLDVQMPGMSGIELARHLSAQAAHGRMLMPMVVFVT
ncbi:MAG: response regulator, partial [Betaproteobacteria bacterium]|nr:response regulator [Betaproteobacteria bacterium]